MLDFDQYLQQTEGDRHQRAANWQTAIGLQAVDGLKTSDYLLQTARQHIEGETDINEVIRLLKSYYQSKSHRTPLDDEMREADLVSANSR